MRRSDLLKRMIVTGLLIAAGIVIARFLSIRTPLVRIGLEFFPMALAAMLYGPVFAGTAWGMADAIGALLFPSGPFFLGFTVSAGLNGLIYGLFLYRHHGRPLRTAAAVLAASLIVTAGLDTLWLQALYGTPAAEVLVSRLIKCAVMLPIQFSLTLFAGRRFSRIIDENGSLAMQKQRLRQLSSAYYNGDFLSERAALSDAVADRLFALRQYREANTVFCFAGRANEIDTARIIETALRDGKRVAVPLCGEKPMMTAREIRDLSALRRGAFGIPEPGEDCPVIPPEEIDLALIPASMCDGRGVRIGFGGGYYDRFLKDAGALRVALVPDRMLKKRLPSAPHDLRMDAAVTEWAVIAFLSGKTKKTAGLPFLGKIGCIEPSKDAIIQEQPESSGRI